METTRRTIPSMLRETMLPDEEFGDLYHRLVGTSNIIQKIESHMRMCLSQQSFNAWSLRHYSKLSESVLKRSLLFLGAPGTGKTITAKGCADHYARTENSPVVFLEVGEPRSKFVGESSKNVKAVFDYARSIAEQRKVVLFVDEFDSVGVSRDTNQMHDDVAAMVNTLNQHMTSLQTNPNVFIIACSNLERRIDHATKRRFDFTIEFKRPDADQRKDLLTRLLENYNFDEDEIIRAAKKTKDYTQDDITRVVNLAVENAFAENAPVTNEHLAEAIEDIKPTGEYA
ncbi:MAG: ATP-binding protein [Candidatus Nitrosotenuis sp.]|nr:MAG: ATP-binding protein [Candidatus Nitrosotenuis sp.]